MKNSRDILIVIIVLFLTALIFTWPLVLHLNSAIPCGSEPPPLAKSHLALIEWSGKAFDGNGSYWNAPFFYPYKGSFAWWEPQPFTCLLIWFIAKLTGYIVAYNIVIFFYLIGFGLVGYATVRLLTDDRTAALWSAIWLTGGSYMLQQICSPALISVVFPCACIYFIFVFFKNNKRFFFWLAVLTYILTWTTCKQFAGFLTVILPVLLIPFLSSAKIKAAGVVHFILALAVILIIILPYSLQQLSYVEPMGFEYSIDNIKSILKWRDLFLPAEGHWLVTHILGWGNQRLYYSWNIGIVAFLIIFASLGLGILKSAITDNFKRKMIISLVLISIIALLLGFGLRAALVIKGGNYGLYSLFYSIIPGFEFIRSPGRFGIFVILGVCVLAGLAFSYIRSRINNKNTRLTLTLLAFVLLSAEMWTIPIPLVFPDKEIKEHEGAIEWLHKNGAGRPVLELPLAAGRRTADMDLEAGAMLRALRHGNPIINGYMSFSPSAYKQLRLSMLFDVLLRGRRYIEAYGVRYVFLHKDMLTDKQMGNMKQAFSERIVYEDDKDVIYEMGSEIFTRDIKQILPVKAKLSQRPQEGKIYALPLVEPATEAVLIMPQPDWTMDLTWPDDSAVFESKRVRICGSIILDTAHGRFLFQILSFSAGDREGRARLIAPEEAFDLLRRQRLLPEK